MDTKKLEYLLKFHNIKPSHHRMRVYQYLIENRNHPNVDMIYRDLINEIPTLSRTTLYNTLSLFVEKGLVTLITIEENENRYDADTSMHAHFKCIECEKIFDIGLELPPLDLSEWNEFEFQESHIYFKGICPICLKRGDQHIN